MTTSAQSGGPPTKIGASALFQKLMEMPRPTKVMRFPRRGPDGSFIPEELALVVLTSAEQQKARAAAEFYTLDLLRGNPDGVPFKQVVDVVGGRSLAYDEIYRNELAIETLVLACRDPKDAKQSAFPNSQLARAFLTTDEISCLFMAYIDHQQECGPIVSQMTVPTMDAWIRVLQEGASRVPLAQLSLEAVKDLLLHSVSLLPRSPTDSGSAGSPPAESFAGTGISLPSDAERPGPLVRDE